MKKFVACLLLPLGTSHAEPGPLTEYLTNEPATLFDVGMVRLENLTTEFEKRVGLSWAGATGGREFFDAEVNSSYSSEDDRIYVSFLIMNSEATHAQMEEGCRVAIAQMAIWLGKSLPALFSHVRQDNPPEDLSDSLYEMVVVRCHVSSRDSTAEGRFWASQSVSDFLQGLRMNIGRWD